MGGEIVENAERNLVLGLMTFPGPAGFRDGGSAGAQKANIYCNRKAIDAWIAARVCGGRMKNISGFNL